jgi:FdhD protein
VAGSTHSEQQITERGIQRWAAGNSSQVRDELVVEEPLELRAHGETLAVIMRTPGHDLELLGGLLHAEGVLRADDGLGHLSVVDAEELEELERGNVVELHLSKELVAERWSERKVLTSSACGVCGASALAILEGLAVPVLSDLQWSHKMISGIPDKLQDLQAVFQRSGALHGAALFSKEGEALVCREDVGRHNAVDKVVGWARDRGDLPLSQCVLGVSGRLSYEIVHKAIAAGLPIIVAVSAPSSLAVDLAERWRVTLAGFVRGNGFNVYSHASRITG